MGGMVSIELPEAFVRWYAEMEYGDVWSAGLKYGIADVCKKWVLANPEIKKKRSMTTEEKVKWLIPRQKDYIILIYKDGIGPCKKGEDITIRSIENAVGWAYNGGARNEFEVEVTE